MTAQLINPTGLHLFCVQHVVWYIPRQLIMRVLNLMHGEKSMKEEKKPKDDKEVDPREFDMRTDGCPNPRPAPKLPIKKQEK